MGEGNKEEAEKILGTGVTTLFFLSLTLSFVFFTFGQDFLQLFGASNETLPFAWDYLKIISLGAITIQFALGLNPYISTRVCLIQYDHHFDWSDVKHHFRPDSYFCI